MPCIFCKLAQEGKEPFLQNDLFYARLDIHPVSPCHTLVIPKRHVARKSDLTADEVMALHTLCTEVVVRIESMETMEKYRIYEKLAFEQLTENSVLYCVRATKHPWLHSKPEGYNEGCNQGECAGQTIEHFHWHIIPRYWYDMRDPRGGVRHAIPCMGNYYLEPGYEPEEE